MSLIHTCLRITDIDQSVAFYNALGLVEVRRGHLRDEAGDGVMREGATNVFMTLPEDGDEPRLELMYNPGVESYEVGTGYGHMALTTPDIDALLATLSEAGIKPESPPHTVRERGRRICFVRDPDSYRIEIVEVT